MECPLLSDCVWSSRLLCLLCLLAAPCASAPTGPPTAALAGSSEAVASRQDYSTLKIDQSSLLACTSWGRCSPPRSPTEQPPHLRSAHEGLALVILPDNSACEDPCLALPCLALPCLALPCLALPFVLHPACAGVCNMFVLCPSLLPSPKTASREAAHSTTPHGCHGDDSLDQSVAKQAYYTAKPQCCSVCA